jgi:hypothetical protein
LDLQKFHRRLAVLLAAVSLVAAGRGVAQEASPPPPPQPERSPASRLTWLSGRAVYPTYLADWKSPEFFLGYLAVKEATVPEAGASRLGMKLGTRFAFARWSPRQAPDRPWQLEGEAGFVGITDRDHKLDFIGWDGTYALFLTREFRPGWFLQLGTKHLSAHLGDEYGERTGRRRVGYTREEITLGAAWRSLSQLTAYIEAGVSYDLRDAAEQDRWRVQAGIQREWLPAGEGRRSFFAAANVEMLEEMKWQPDFDVQAGLGIRAGDRRWRLGVHYRNGRTPLGEFTRFRESYAVLGVWLIL